MTNTIHDTYIENIQREHNGAAQYMAQIREHLARGEYSLAQFCALRMAERLTNAEKWRFAASGTEYAITEQETAQIHSAAIERAQENAQEYEYNPENAQTVAELRESLKYGNADAAALVNDLISDNPNQATAWITRTDIDEIENDLTDGQRADLMEYLRTEYELIDTPDELRNAREMLDI